VTALAQQFGRRIQRERLARGWTQVQLAAKAGLNQKVISNYESGKSEPGLGSFMALARAFGMSLDALAGLNGGTP
jgi:transcriptional regulator with XRE-family HTH domain